MRFYTCNGCLDLFPPDKLIIAELIVGDQNPKKIAVSLCDDCVWDYDELGMLVKEGETITE